MNPVESIKQTLKVGYIPNKVWGPGSVYVPDKKPDVTHFHGFNDLFYGNPDNESLFTCDYWDKKLISGSIKLPGEWNYCYIDGLGFHMVQLSGAGVWELIKPDNVTEEVEFFNYQLVYDDWVNEFLENKINVTGTVTITGDTEKIWNNILRTVPILQDLNGVEEFNAQKKEVNRNVNILEASNKFKDQNGFRWFDPRAIKYFNEQLSSGYERIEPDKNRFESPFLINESWLGNWKYSLYCGLLQYLNPSQALQIYDIKPENIQVEQFKGKYRNLLGVNVDQKIYSISKDSTTHVINVGGQKAKNIYLNNFDFSGLNDIIELDAQTYQDKPINELTWRKIIEKIKTKTGSDFGIYECFEETINIMHRYGGPIFTNNIQDWQSNINTIRETQLNTLGFFKKLVIREKKYDEKNWKLNGLTFSSQWKEVKKPGDYIGGYQYQRNHILTRNLGLATSSIYLGDRITYTDKIGIQQLRFRNWIDQLKKNNPEDDQNFKKLIDDQKIFAYNYEGLGEQNWLYRLQLIKHLDRYELLDGKTNKVLKPTRGIIVLPDYDNNGWVLANYSAEEIKTGVRYNGGINKIFHAREILALTSKPIKTKIDRPTEELRTGSNYQGGNLSVRMGIIVRKLLETFFWIKEETEERLTFIDEVGDNTYLSLPVIPWKSWYKPFNGSYWRKTDGNFGYLYCIPDIPQEYNWFCSFPYNSDGKIIRILEKYHGSPYLKYIGPKPGDKKTFDAKDKNHNPTCLLFDQDNTENYTKEVKYNDLPDEIKRESVFVWVKLTRQADDNTKQEIKNMCLELWEEFFKTAWTNGYHYDAAAFIGGIKGWKNLNPQSHSAEKWKEQGATLMTHFRPYKNIWYVSGLKMGMIQGVIKNGNYFKGLASLSTPAQIMRFSTNSIITFNTNKPIFVVPRIDEVHYSQNVLTATIFDETGWNISLLDKSRLAVYFYLFGGQLSYKVDNTYPLHEIQSKYSIDQIDIPDYKNFIYDSTYSNSKSEWNEAITQQNRVWNAAPSIRKIINREFSTISHLALNPTSINWEDYYLNDEYKKIKLEQWLDEPLPHYLSIWLDPDNPSSETHNLNQKLTLESYKTLLRTWITNIHSHLYSSGFYIDLKGTKFIAFVRYLAQNWIYELIPKINDVFGNTKKQAITFQNEKTESVDDLPAIINSTCELNIYGQKIPIKDRIKLNGNNIDLNLTISQINDPYQSASEWYHIETDSEQATLRQEIEVPKEQAISSNVNIMDRQNLLKMYQLNHADRHYERVQYEIEKRKTIDTLAFQQHEIGLDFANNLANSISGAFTGLTNLLGKGKGSGLFGLIGGTTTLTGIASSFGKLIIGLQKHNTEYAATLENYALQNISLSKKHQRAAELDKLSLYNMATNNNNAQFSNPLIYTELNKLRNRTDVFLTRYKPKGWLLDKIKEHYEKYGFETWLPNETCTGIIDIKKHIKFEVIENNEHDNPNIREMIENRLLTGIKVIPLE